MKNQLDTKVKRGSRVKALAFGSREKFMEPYKQTLNKALQEIFEKEDVNASPEVNL